MKQWIILRVKTWVQPELDRTRGLLRQANVALDKALRENMNLKNRNEQLNTRVNELESGMRDLRRELDRERETTQMQAEVIARMESAQQRLEQAMGKAEEKMAYMTDRIMKLEIDLRIFHTDGSKDK